VTQTASSLLGYLTVFAICGVTALVAAGLLFIMPKFAFANVGETLVEESKSRTRRWELPLLASSQFATDHLVRGCLGNRLDRDEVQVDEWR
jgi:hypothetical protein